MYQCFKHSYLIGHFFLYRGTKGTIILLNIFKFYILKYFIKFLQSHDNNKKKTNSTFIISRDTCKNLTERRLRMYQCFKHSYLIGQFSSIQRYKRHQDIIRQRNVIACHSWNDSGVEVERVSRLGSRSPRSLTFAIVLERGIFARTCVQETSSTSRGRSPRGRSEAHRTIGYCTVSCADVKKTKEIPVAS